MTTGPEGWTAEDAETLARIVRKLSGSPMWWARLSSNNGPTDAKFWNADERRVLAKAGIGRG